MHQVNSFFITLSERSYFMKKEENKKNEVKEEKVSRKISVEEMEKVVGGVGVIGGSTRKPTK
jgi:hypothetical protein